MGLDIRLEIEQINYLQKRAVRLVAGIKKWEHSGPSFTELRLLRIDQIKDFQIGEFYYRLEHGLLPSTESDRYSASPLTA